jgi:hypothetical protein
MKRFIVIGNSIALDVSNTEKKPPDNGFLVTAPDWVFEGWGYDARKSGDDRFIKPRPPEGWVYDPETGTVCREADLK